MDFAARRHSVDGTEHVAITGELDLAATPVLQEVLGEGGGGKRRVVIDASELTFVDVRGISTLVECGESLLASGGELVVRAAPPCLLRVLELTGLGSALQVEPA